MNKSQGMVDISGKKITKRVAVASATIVFHQKSFNQLISSGSPKGDVFETAKIAGINAAKATSSIIPLCHPLLLSKVSVSFEIDRENFRVEVIAHVIAQGQTGVEMEALTAATVACLSIYDMMKWADKTILISEVKLLKKTGGKSGNFIRKN